MTRGAWNDRTLLDRHDRPERRTALVARMLDRYQIDTAALSETWFAGETQLEEVGGGYTFYCIGKPEGTLRTSGVGFAIRSKLARQSKDSFTTVIRCYAPKMTNTDDEKEAFHDELNNLISTTNRKDKLIILGDVNARVGKEHNTWPKVIGRHGTGKCNSNGLLLLTLCAEHELPTSE
ncbi:hypothetical protein V1264_022576 [Littorina saxatilis]|uniref:Endonuclease/exonuclease/phosphatase domain-containing protein n=1 Tax=Littorina saxatilis TaxID=31220 RepID=A0AAN9FXZ0_9CAEN